MDKLTVKLQLNTESLQSFITDYFNSNQPATYHSNGRRQCFALHKRSFTDIARLCKSYFECTEQEVAETMINLWEKNTVQVFFCPTTRKPVFFKTSIYWNDDYTTTPNNFNPNNPINVRDTYNKPLTKGTDGYSFVDIYNLAKNKN